MTHVYILFYREYGYKGFTETFGGVYRTRESAERAVAEDARHPRPFLRHYGIVDQPLDPADFPDAFLCRRTLGDLP